MLDRLETVTGAGADLDNLYDAGGVRVKRTLDGVDTSYLTDGYEITVDGPTSKTVHASVGKDVSLESLAWGTNSFGLGLDYTCEVLE